MPCAVICIEISIFDHDRAGAYRLPRGRGFRAGRYSQGSFKGVMCAYETEGVGWPCVLIRGDPWLFDACQARPPPSPRPALRGARRSLGALRTALPVSLTHGDDAAP